MIIAKFLRTAFFKEHLRWLFLKTVTLEIILMNFTVVCELGLSQQQLLFYDLILSRQKQHCFKKSSNFEQYWVGTTTSMASVDTSPSDNSVLISTIWKETKDAKNDHKGYNALITKSITYVYSKNKSCFYPERRAWFSIVIIISKTSITVAANVRADL